MLRIVRHLVALLTATRGGWTFVASFRQLEDVEHPAPVGGAAEGTGLQRPGGAAEGPGLKHPAPWWRSCRRPPTLL